MAIKKTKGAASSRAKSAATKSSTTTMKKKVRKRKKAVKAVRSLVDTTSTDTSVEVGNNANETPAAIAPGTEVAAGLDATVGLEESWAEKIRAYRKRQDSVASILDGTMGVLAKCDPKLWGQRAYWMLVGLVYERLAVCEDEISTGELVSLAKILAENRRVEVRSRSEKLSDNQDERNDNKSSDRMSELPTGKLPEGLVGSVRQIYGVELEDSYHKNRNASTKK